MADAKTNYKKIELCLWGFIGVSVHISPIYRITAEKWTAATDWVLETT